MKLIVGLGNPGNKYLFTRHNIGFMVIDTLCESSSFQNKHKSLIQKKQISNQSILLVKPQTYMNLSGEAVREIIHFYKIPLDNILIIQDDKDQNFLSLKFQKTRGDGGHNGIKNISQELNTNDYCRLKIGVAPLHSNEEEEQVTIQNTSDFVLSPFSKKEMKDLPDFLKLVEKSISCFIEKGWKETANQYNQKTG